jgi:hypothetical protein
MKLFELLAAHDRAGEQQWRDQAASGINRQIFVKTRGGKRYGPFKDDGMAKQFITSRTDLGPGASVEYT